VTGLIDRAVRVSNAPDYGGLEQIRVLADYSQPAMKRRLADADLFLVAELAALGPKDALCGVLVARRAREPSAGDAAVIEALFVDPAAQGMGVGGALVDAMTARARQVGVRRIGVAASLSAVGFYAHMGFSRIARGRSHAGVATVTMERVLR
jgi:GNAT superfamily N-acetyltransferase